MSSLVSLDPWSTEARENQNGVIFDDGVLKGHDFSRAAIARMEAGL
jgi:hypothetical protein